MMFSRSLEKEHSSTNLRTAIVEKLHATSLHIPPSLAGKGVRGLGQ